MSHGWVKTHRKIQSHWLWNDEPYSKGQAWIDITLMANHAPAKVVFRDELIAVSRGSFITSKLKLSEKWRWSRVKIDHFFRVLEREGMLVIKSDKRKTIISIVNYNTYQGQEEDDSTTDSASNNTTDKQQIGQQKSINKNDKEERRMKKNLTIDKPILFNYGNFIRMTSEQMDKLKTRFGIHLIDQELPDADEWVAESTTPNGRKYRKPDHNHYLFLLGWLKDKRLAKAGSAPMSKFKTNQEITEDNLNNFMNKLKG